MKIAVASTGPTLDAPVATQFQCSKYLLIIDLKHDGVPSNAESAYDA